MKPETKLFWKYIGIGFLAFVVLLLILFGESIIINLLEPIK